MGKRITLCKVGSVPMTESLRLGDKIKAASVSRRAQRRVVAIQVNVVVPMQKPPARADGVPA